MKESRKFELARLKKKKHILAVWRLSCFGTFAMRFSATGCVVRHAIIMDYKLAVLRNLFILACIPCPRYPYI